MLFNYLRSKQKYVPCEIFNCAPRGPFRALVPCSQGRYYSRSCVLCTCLPSFAFVIISTGIKQQFYIYTHTKPVSTLYSELKAFIKIPSCQEMKSRALKNLKYSVTAWGRGWAAFLNSNGGTNAVDRENGSPFQRLATADELLNDALARVKRLRSERPSHLLMEAEVGLSFLDGRNPFIISEHHSSQTVLTLIESHLDCNLWKAPPPGPLCSARPSCCRGSTARSPDIISLLNAFSITTTSFAFCVWLPGSLLSRR